ncbi:MAG TPA: hypothetical protein PLO19_01270 [Candidatus Cryosericum sp.]|nr:hypothetical protein [Candidatus Cryosericum sp.]
MYLLVIITTQEEKTYEYLRLLPAVGVRGATVVDGKGMGRILQDHDTVYTSLEQVLSASIDLRDNVIILSLLEGGKSLVAARQLAHRVFGDFSRPNTGVMFVLPITDAEGLTGVSSEAESSPSSQRP